MATQDTGAKLRILLVYLALGAATFVVVSAWVFVGLRLWGHN